MTTFSVKINDHKFAALIATDDREYVILKTHDDVEIAEMIYDLRAGADVEEIEDNYFSNYWHPSPTPADFESFVGTVFATHDGLLITGNPSADWIVTDVLIREDHLRALATADSHEEIANLVESHLDAILHSCPSATTADMIAQHKIARDLIYLAAEKMPASPTAAEIASLTITWNTIMSSLTATGSVNIFLWRTDENGDEHDAGLDFAQATRLEIATENVELRLEPKYRNINFHDDFVHLIGRFLHLADVPVAYESDGNSAWSWYTLNK